MKAFAALAIVYLLGATSQALGAQILEFSPIAGAPGDQIQLTGYGFLSGKMTVRFWNGGSGVVAKIVYTNSDTIMTVQVPSGITTGPLSVQKDSGVPTYTADNFLAIGAGPFITGFAPEFGDVGTSVTIFGVHLAKTSQVLFNGTRAGFWPNSDGTAISTSVPAGAITGPITVTTPSGTSNSPTAFTVLGPGPYVREFIPNSGQAGTLVQIYGMHLTGTSKVTFNGVAGVKLAIITDTFIQVEAPAGVTTGPIGLTTSLGSTVTSSVFYAAPVIMSFSPAFGRVNTNITIKGANFIGTTGVWFDKVPASGFQVLNNSNLNANVPVGATNGPLRVATEGGFTSSGSNFVVRPTISGFSPTFGPAGTSVTITGANFNVGTPVVKFNGVAASAPTAIAFNQLKAQVPSGASTGPISLTTADGSDTSVMLFYLPPAITSFSPSNSAPGNRIQITGKNLLGTTAVSFNGAPATAFTATNNTAISATVPAGVVTGPISITTPAGTVSSTTPFYGAPRISSFTPTHGVPGNTVKINGQNLLAGSVQFNGLNATISSINNTQIVTTVPTGAKTGQITVRGPAGTAPGPQDFVLDYFSDLRVSVVHSANPVTIGSNLLYTITIVNAGPYTAQNPCFTNVLPVTVRLVSATIAGPWTLTTNRNVLIGTMGACNSGNSYVLKVAVVPQVTGNITNVVSVDSDNPDPAGKDNVASLVTTVEPLPLLSVALVADKVQVSWSVNLTNFVLQYQNGVSVHPSWAPVSTPATIVGNVKYVTESKSAPARVYRLHR